MTLMGRPAQPGEPENHQARLAILARQSQKMTGQHIGLGEKQTVVFLNTRWHIGNSS
jgi:hypothetical protein